MNNKTLKVQISTFLMLFLSIVAFGQEHSTNGRTIFGTKLESINPKNGLVKCVSSEYEKHIHNTTTERATTAQFEAWIAPKVEEIKKRLLAFPNETNVITIPVVVHVIHNGDALGANENISDARILSQITTLNQDFRRMLNTPGYNDNAIGADIEVQFCMAQRNPTGGATNGIDRVNLNTVSWATTTSVETNLKPQTSWDPNQYFNIWVAAFSNSASAELNGVLGYAQFPSASGLGGLNSNGGLSATDGVILDYRCFGSSSIAPGNYFTDYDKGRTLTHEIGHCFGLRHIWGDNSSCTTNATDSFKDFCPDTPAANAANFDCLNVYDTCPLALENDMTENYMDYTNDICMNTFTLNQKARMLAVLQNSPRRSNLKSSLACQSLSSETFGSIESLSVFPNPANDVVNIGLGTSDVLPTSYSIYNTLGQIVAVKTITTTSDLKIDISAINAGIYFIQIERDNAFKTFKFIKK